MAKIRVTKKFSFDMAHALDGYDGLCKNIHGHTYHFSITLLGEVLVEIGNPKNGFVLDFSELKSIVKESILDIFDHSLVLFNESKIAKQGNLSLYSDRVIYTPYQPTCENLLVDFKDRIVEKLPSGIELIVARLDETPTSYAEWFSSDQD